MILKITSKYWIPRIPRGIRLYFKLMATGGTKPYTWSFVSGNLPTGVNVSPAGIVSGFVSQIGTFKFKVQLKDRTNKKIIKEFGIVIYENTKMAHMCGYGNEGQLSNYISGVGSKLITLRGVLNNVNQIALGYVNAAAIKNDGTLWTWGSNSAGQLGNGNRRSRSSPVQTIALGNNWKQISCGLDFMAAIKNDGSLWTWGSNTVGQLGNNRSASKNGGLYEESRPFPIQTVCKTFDWKQVSCGWELAAAIKNNGTLWVWGSNFFGGLGNNKYTTSIIPNDKSSPIQTIAGGTNWKQVSCGFHFNAAIKTDGSLWLWGRNYNGQLGDNTTIDRSSPVQTIAGGKNWKYVSTGNEHTAAIKNDGSLWCWGKNNHGQLGDNTTVNKSSPVQTISFGAKWKEVSCGYYHTFGIKENYTLWGWGKNSEGQLGLGKLPNQSIPTIVGANWQKISCFGYASGAIKKD